MTAVLKYHAPGLAPIALAEGACHVNKAGVPAYARRFWQVFGYYDLLAAVNDESGWYHIHPDGQAAYAERYVWCGNFQEQVCVVADHQQHYFHIDHTGKRLYSQHYCYAGDFKDGVAAIQDSSGRYTHIDKQGALLHAQWFLDLDVYHKGYARAKDEHGWCHINENGAPIYKERYTAIEPFYNGAARVETIEAAILVIDATGHVMRVLRPSRLSTMQRQLSADLVGYWKTQTIYAAVALNVFAELPNDAATIAKRIGIAHEYCHRLLWALAELQLVILHDSVWQLTDKGQLLSSRHPYSMASAARVWGEDHYQRWSQLAEVLKGNETLENDYFTKLGKQPNQLKTYQCALAHYATLDYQAIVHCVDWQQHRCVIDTGGGTGALLTLINRQHPQLQCILLEKSEVIHLIKDVATPFTCYSVNFFEPWPCRADAIILARVLHDWSDDKAIKLLSRAAAALTSVGSIYIIEMMLSEETLSGHLLDLNMLVMTGGKERSLAEWTELLQHANLRLTNTLPINEWMHLLVVSKADE